MQKAAKEHKGLLRIGGGGGQSYEGGNCRNTMIAQTPTKRSENTKNTLKYSFQFIIT